MMCGKGFGMVLVLVWATALSSDLSLVSGQTVAPLVTSTVKPTSAPKVEATPTKPMIVNAPPSKHKKAEPQLKAKDGSKPLQVTGFITKSGNIYEIEDKRGLGSIEGRQAIEEKQADQIVCNYGNVVIYSDVPCDEVTNVRVGDVKQIKEGPIDNEENSTTEKGPADGEKDPQEDQDQDQDQGQQEQSNTPRQQGNNRRRRRRPQQQQQQRLQQQRRRQQQQLQQRRRRNGNGNGNVVRRRRNRNQNGNNNNNNLRRGQQQQRRRRPNNNNNNNNRRRNGNNNNNNRLRNGNNNNNNRMRQQQRRRINNNNNNNRNRQQQRRRVREGIN
ncbi:hypothetical protein KR009_002155 [Drosophila setifemur]|nr:hypothetical protein KR009_002155 [Drosophila setifemur]